jgi:ATP-dependent DNA helicase RecG
MPLPINIHQLLNGQVVEWERLEFKEGWNPEAVLHTLCAFANDFNNWGGGYLVIGVAEHSGRPVLPPVGLEPNQLDPIQRKMIELGHKLRPAYHPIMVPALVDGRHVLVVWAPGGDLRPYQSPVSLAETNRESAYYIRRGSATVRARGADEQELLGLANRVPFDDRVNTRAAVSDLQLALIQNFLRDVRSDLLAASARMPFDDLCRQMRLVGGPPEGILPVNVGLLFFSSDPIRFFPQTQIDVVLFPEGKGGDRFTEKTFKGPLGALLREALAYLQSAVVIEHVHKHPDRAEAERYLNVPYAALEEVLVNAVYHRSYEEREPIEVQVTPEEVTVASYPGPDRSINLAALRQGKAIAHRYRNRRIGEFLKELELSEGRGTGIPKILHAMKRNGSPEPQFETDEDRTYFVARLPLRPAKTGQADDDPNRKPAPSYDSSTLVTGQVTGQVAGQALRFCATARRAADIQKQIGIKHRETFLQNYLRPLLAIGWLAPTLPDTPRSPNQRYVITDLGRKQLTKFPAA